MRSAAELALDILPAAPAYPRQILVYWPDCEHARLRDCLLFGPNCWEEMVESDLWKDFKKIALLHVLENSQCELPRILEILRTIENQARAAYDGDRLIELEDSDKFLQVMAEDGCLFLLVGFFILGGGRSRLLKFPPQHPIFGTGRHREHMDVWLHSMFLVGNQIPFVVLEKLMELSFFGQVIATIRSMLPRPPSNFANEILYKFLMVEQETKPLDLIDSFRSTVLGSKDDSNAAIPPLPTDDDEGYEMTYSAKKLYEMGTVFRKLDRGVGIRGSYYQHDSFRRVLYLPAFHFGKYAELMIRCLQNHEYVHEEEIKQEVRSYFQFLGELIRTKEDVDVLASFGVIRGQELEILPQLLHTDDNPVPSEEHFRRVRREIRENSPPWWRKISRTTYGAVFSGLALLFAYLQAQYSILGYSKGTNY